MQFNTSNNETFTHYYISHSFTLVYDLLMVILGIIIVSINLIIIIIYCKSRYVRQKTANLLLFNQALVDFFQGAVTNGISVFGSNHFILKLIIYQFSIALSLHTVVLVSIERYVFILRPLFHKRNVTIFQISIAITLSWISSLLWIPFRMAHLTSPNIDARDYTVYYIAISDAIFFVLIVMMSYIYMSTFTTVRRFIKKRYDKITIRNQQKSLSQRQQLKLRQHLRELRTIKLFISMFVVFIISYLPLFITGLIHISDASATFTSAQLQYMSLDVVFYLCNSVFNPTLTLVYKEDYKREFKRWARVVAKKICRYEMVDDSIQFHPNASEIMDLSTMSEKTTVDV